VITALAIIGGTVALFGIACFVGKAMRYGLTGQTDETS